MLEDVRKFGLEIPKPTPEEQEIFDRMEELIDEIKEFQDAHDLASARFAPESTMTDGTPESTMEVAQKADILCLPDDPNPPAVCDGIDWGFA